MSNRRSPTVYVLPLLIWSVVDGLPAARADQSDVENQQLADTVRRFFRALDGFEPGDLIVASEVEDLQDYLRGTWGHNLLTSPRVVRRTTPDKATLSRLFHSPGGKPVLRKVAQKLGGYDEIDQLCRYKSGRKVLLNAIMEQDATLILDEVSRHQNAEIADATSRAANSGAADRRKPAVKCRLYTVEQMIGEYLIGREESIATASTPGAKPQGRINVHKSLKTDDS